MYYQYRGTHPSIRGKVGQIVNKFDQDWVEFVPEGTDESYRVKLVNLTAI